MNVLTDNRLNDFQKEEIAKAVKSHNNKKLYTVVISWATLVSTSMTLQLFGVIDEKVSNLAVFLGWLYVLQCVAYGMLFVFMMVIFKVFDYATAERAENSLPWSKQRKERHSFMKAMVDIVNAGSDCNYFAMLFSKYINYWTMICMAALGWYVWATIAIMATVTFWFFKYIITDMVVEYYSKLTPEKLEGIEREPPEVNTRDPWAVPNNN